MLPKELLLSGEDSMKKTIEKMKHDFSTVRTGRANPAVLDNLKIESYGSMMILNQLAGISVPDGRTLEIRPWDISQLAAIEKAILKSDLGLTPINDGKIIRISIPSLTEERRKEIIKVINKMSEDYKVAIRNERRHIVDGIKKSEKDKLITEDDRKKYEVDSQKLTDIYIKKIEELVVIKEQDLMKI
ncbi:MAG: ribosome recycling factor [Endomicrobiia bacterium]|jgi:ribosome recycling factor|nr:ribosome recycling factor [Endomicrobiaceae bacterium]MDD3052868.1 ribosome recycling factor [Endomicrobiaceae bacterium]MDD3922090.1 ribosome recycling factor [Endomicrobiaceae bacterium]MDD5101948.1 ribosome recycling factor [Endomicrobiaceae bacterium]